MRRNNDKRRVGTLGQIKAERRQLRWCCENGCARTVDADLDALIERFGAAFPLQSALELVRCTVCNARWPHVGCQAVPIDVPQTEGYVGFTPEYLWRSGSAKGPARELGDVPPPPPIDSRAEDNTSVSA